MQLMQIFPYPASADESLERVMEESERDILECQTREDIELELEIIDEFINESQSAGHEVEEVRRHTAPTSGALLFTSNQTAQQNYRELPNTIFRMEIEEVEDDGVWTEETFPNVTVEGDIKPDFSTNEAGSQTRMQTSESRFIPLPGIINKQEITGCQSYIATAATSAPGTCSFIKQDPSNIFQYGGFSQHDPPSCAVNSPAYSLPFNIPHAGQELAHKASTSTCSDVDIYDGRMPYMPPQMDSPTFPNISAEVEVQGLKDVYYKRTRKVQSEMEYRLRDSIVSMVVCANNATITKVNVFVERCKDAALMAHDTTGPVELRICHTQHGAFSTTFSVDLDSVYKTECGDFLYRLEKADIEERNKWELIIFVELAGLVTRRFKTKPFQFRTKPRSESSNSSEETVDNATLQRTGTSDRDEQSSPLSTNSRFSDPDAGEVFPDMTANNPGDLRQIMTQISRDFESFASQSRGKVNTATPVPKPPVLLRAFGRVFLRSDTQVDINMVASKYNEDTGIHYVSEQPDFPGLLKVMRKPVKTEYNSRRRANGYRSANEDFIWTCGHCYFARKKKSTVKSHVEQTVCQRSLERREMRNRRTMLEWDYRNAMHSTRLHRRRTFSGNSRHRNESCGDQHDDHKSM